ncbi:MAG: cytochrome b [Alphaproteobacteria bacterium]|nr:cytochrome b [Alphaproteobacteria bacterium]
MSIYNTTNQYGIIAKTFHWGMALLIFGMIGIGLWMADLPDSLFKLQIYFWHISFGVLVLFLVCARLLWRWTNPRPLLPTTLKQWQIDAVHVGHTLLYFMMFLMPLSGWLMTSSAGFDVSFFKLFNLPTILKPQKALFEIFSTIHEIGAFALIGLIAGHIGAALLHHFYFKDTILRRMLPWPDKKQS